MEIVSRAAACAVIGSILALLLRKYTPELSLTTTLITGMVIVWISSAVCLRIAESLRDIAHRSGVETVYLAPVLKCIGIGMVSHMAAQICRDAGQGSAASAVELCAGLCALYAALPLIESLLAVVERLL